MWPLHCREERPWVPAVPSDGADNRLSYRRRRGHQAGATLDYTDNGDGTITDNDTGLQWEKKSDDGTIHDKDNTYTWEDAFAVHVATLNAEEFAGHTDWRLPNVGDAEHRELRELQTGGISSVQHQLCGERHGADR
jgi:hypothetical protein